jgi:hypothetical protein
MKCKALLIGLFATTRIFAFEGTITQIAKNYRGQKIDCTLVWYINPKQIRMDTKAIMSNGNLYHEVWVMDAVNKVTLQYILSKDAPKAYIKKNITDLIDYDVRLDLTGVPSNEHKIICGQDCEKWVIYPRDTMSFDWICKSIDVNWASFEKYSGVGFSYVMDLFCAHNFVGFPLQSDAVRSETTIIAKEVLVMPISKGLFKRPKGYHLYNPDKENYSTVGN